jgi:hypothetical protein
VSYLLVGALLFAFVYWGGRQRILKHPEWRVASGVAAIGAFTAAGFVGLRGGWGKAVVLAMLGLLLATASRWPR